MMNPLVEVTVYPPDCRPPNAFRLAYLAALMAATVLVVPRPARAERVQLDKPVQVSTVKADKTPLSGRVSAYDDEGFELARGREKPVKVRWSELGPPGVFNVRSALLGPRATAEQWLELGGMLAAMQGGEPLAERAFARALKLDPKLKEVVEEAKQEAKAGTRVSTPGSAEDRAGDADAEGVASAGGPNAAGGPQMVGKVRAGPWPAMT